jgi:D-alanyl-D-alanine carboxypeptidase (penicillin-binding protein 5/6)
MKRILALLTAASILATPALAIETKRDDEITISAPSAVLMEKDTGEVLYEKNAHEKMEPASVTKVMTLLLVVEAIEAGSITLDDMVTASAHAAGMGGSQIWLEEGEQMSVSEMLKCVTVVSANDCAVALAEYIAGTEEEFVRRMNERAAELGMADTNFTNCTGLLDDAMHKTCAYDIALMSRELIKHDLIKEYTTIWMDTVRDGRFTLSNTNKLIYYYDGATGLKTGYTSTAMYCLSATAERDGTEYIAVVLHGESSAERFESAKTLLNYAFANYSVVSLSEGCALPPVAVSLGEADCVLPQIEGADAVLTEKGGGELRFETELAENLVAPVEQGQELGYLRAYRGEELIAEVPLVASESVARLRTGEVYLSLVGRLFGGKN